MCSNTFLPHAFAHLGAFYFAPLASPSYLTFAVSPCLTWKTRRNWITGNDDLRTNGLSGDRISRRRGEVPRRRAGREGRKKGRGGRRAGNGKHGGAKCYRASTIDSSSHGVSLQETFAPRPHPPYCGAQGRKLSYDVTATPPESRSIWKRGTTRRRPRNLRYHSRHLPSVAGAIPCIEFPPRSSFALRDKALFQDFLCSLHRTDITYRLLTGGQGLIPWREPGSGECVQNLNVYAFPGTFPLKLRHFSRIFNRWEQLVFGARQSPRGFLR